MKVAVGVLGLLLILSNLYWVLTGADARLAALDADISINHCREELGNRQRTIEAAAVLMPLLSQGGQDAEGIIRAFDEESRESGGFIYTNGLGFKVSEDGKVTEVTTQWEQGPAS